MALLDSTSLLDVPGLAMQVLAELGLAAAVPAGDARALLGTPLEDARRDAAARTDVHRPEAG